MVQLLSIPLLVLLTACSELSNGLPNPDLKKPRTSRARKHRSKRSLGSSIHLEPALKTPIWKVLKKPFTNGTFCKWRPISNLKQIPKNRSLCFDQDKNAVVIKKAGTYYFYAQMNFYGNLSSWSMGHCLYKATNGTRMKRDNPLVCSVSSPNVQNKLESSSLVSGTFNLGKGDVIWPAVKGTDTVGPNEDYYVRLDRHMTYFGGFKI